MNNIPLHDNTTGIFLWRFFFWLVFVVVRNAFGKKKKNAFGYCFCRKCVCNWLVNIWIIFSFWWLWILLLWTFVCRYIVEYLFEVLLDIYSGVELLSHNDNPVLKFLRTFQAFTPLCNPLFFSLLHLPHSETMAKGDGMSLP